MAPVTASMKAVLDAINDLRGRIDSFITRHDGQEREDIKQTQKTNDRLDALEKRMDSIDGKEGHVNIIYAKIRQINGKIIWATAAGSVVLPIAWLIIQWWIMSKLGK